MESPHPFRQIFLDKKNEKKLNKKILKTIIRGSDGHYRLHWFAIYVFFFFLLYFTADNYYDFDFDNFYVYLYELNQT